MARFIQIVIGAILLGAGLALSLLAGHGPMSGVIGLMVGTAFGILFLIVGLFLIARGILQRLCDDE